MQPNIQPLEVDDFSGGLTDYYIDGALNKAQTLDNFVIVPRESKGKLLTRPGSIPYNDDFNQVSGLVERVGTLINHDNDSYLLAQVKRNIYRVPTSGATVAIVGPSSNPVFGGGDETNFVSHTGWNGHTFVTNDHASSNVMKLYEESSTLKVRNAGLPKLATSPTVTAGAAGANSYIYAFLYYYTYTIGSLTFEDFGATTQVLLENTAAPDATTVPITNIPVISNGATENYDTANIKVYIYRTINAGATFYYVGQVTNGTTTYNDTSSDTTIQANALLYTTGGVVDNDPPPKAKYIHITGDICWYAHVTESSQVKKNRIRQSIQFDPDSCPEDFFIDVEDEIVGISSWQSTPLVFTKKFVYRLDGFFDELGRGGISSQRISDTTGCVGQQSIVQTEYGVFFGGLDGFYWTDGFSVRKISRDLPTTYAALITSDTLKKKIYGVYDAVNRRVYWGVNRNASTDNDAVFALHLYWGIRDDMPFTSWSNDALADHFSPTALVYFSTFLIRADRRGYIFKHQDSTLTDPRIDTTSNVDTWGTVAIIYDYKSVAINFGTNLYRKWVPWINIQGENASNLSLQINSYNDANPSSRALKEIRYRVNRIWGDPEDTWGDPTHRWNYVGFLEQKRRFPAGGLRCSYKQVQLTNSYTVVTNSSILSTASVNATTKVATLTDTVTYDWPSDALDYFISFEDDNYVEQFRITARTADTITYLDAANTGPITGTYRWLIKGYRKSEILNLIGYTLHFGYISKTQPTFHGTALETGNNTT